MGRAPCCDKTKVKRGPWSAEEDALLKSFIEAHGTGGNWITLPRKAGLNRCGKSCRLRWLNYLRPNIKHGGFTEEEDYIVCTLFSAIGSRWSVIASKLPGRTDNDVKNYWNTKLKKKLIAGKVPGFETRSGFVQPVQLNPITFTDAKPKPEPITYDHGYNSLASCNIINNIGESSITWENRVPSQQTWDPLHQDSHLTISGQSVLPPLSTSSYVGGCGGGDEAAEDDIDDFWLRLLVDQSSFFAGSSQISGRSHHEKMNGFDTVLDDLFPPSVC